MENKSKLKGILKFFGITILVLGVLIGIFFCVPENRHKFKCWIIANKIEKQLEKKYGMEFDVLEESIESENAEEIYASFGRPQYFEEYGVKYFFMAEYGEEKEDLGETYRERIRGIVNSDIEIISDSYTYFLYEKELVDTLTELLKDTINCEYVVISGMREFCVLTHSKHAGTFEDFYINTPTYDVLHLFVEEGCTDLEIQAVCDKLTEEKFPFTVLIHRDMDGDEEINALKESGALNIWDEDKLYKPIEELGRYFQGWRHDLEYIHDGAYLWYEALGGGTVNGNIIDQIIKNIDKE